MSQGGPQAIGGDDGKDELPEPQEGKDGDTSSNSADLHENNGDSQATEPTVELGPLDAETSGTGDLSGEPVTEAIEKAVVVADASDTGEEKEEAFSQEQKTKSFELNTTDSGPVGDELDPNSIEESNPHEDQGTDVSEDERRQTGRKGVKLNRLISSRVLDGDLHRECYLHLVDISEGGLRVNSDDPFPEDRPFALEISLAAFGTELATRKPRITLPVRLVWTRSLVGGMVVSGLAFQGLDTEGQATVADIMRGASPQGRRQHFRLNRVLGVELEGESGTQWMYPLTLDLSVEGMRICQAETLVVGSKFPIKIFLEFGLPTIETAAEVMWQEVMPSKRVQIGLRFDGLSEHNALAIKTYIDQCLEQDLSHRKI